MSRRKQYKLKILRLLDLIEFTADLKDRKFSSVKLLIDEENVTVDN